MMRERSTKVVPSLSSGERRRVSGLGAGWLMQRRRGDGGSAGNLLQNNSRSRQRHVRASEMSEDELTR